MFRAGLAAYRAARGRDVSTGPGARTQVHHRRGGLGVLLDWVQAARARRARLPRVR